MVRSSEVALANAHKAAQQAAELLNRAKLALIAAWYTFV